MDEKTVTVLKISDEAIEAAARGLADHYTEVSSAAGENEVYSEHDTRDDARAALEAVVPHLLLVGARPDPLPRDDDRDPYAWEPEGVDSQVSVYPDSGEVDFAYWSWSPKAARDLAAALLAAADRADGRS